MLPPGGGDASQISVNFWVFKDVLESGVPGKDGWTVSALYKADRRSANRFDPLTDPVALQIGSRLLQLPPGSLTGTTEKSLSWKSAKGVVPVEEVKLNRETRPSCGARRAMPSLRRCPASRSRSRGVRRTSGSSGSENGSSVQSPRGKGDRERRQDP